MSHLTNPLATADQLYNAKNNLNNLPIELQDSIRYYTARLTQAAGILLRLPQDITAQANILLFRYWLIDPLMAWEYSDVSAAVVYLTAKISASPRSLRSITNVYAYLGSAESSLGLKAKGKEKEKSDGESYYLSESRYITFRNRLLNIEGQILSALGFQTHVALPHPLAITYLQALDIFTPKNKATNVSTSVVKRTIQYLNTALLSPQMLYLTHQPNVLAVAAVYLACREENLRLPESEWWEVFDVEREELGFVVVGMRSVESFSKEEAERWEGVDILKRGDVREDLARRGFGNGNGAMEEDEETRMGRLLDKKVAAV